jgi:hypothetical protein
MIYTNCNKQTETGIEQCLSQHADQPRGDTATIIPFPDKRTSRHAGARSLTRPLHQALRKAKDALLHLSRFRKTTTSRQPRGPVTASKLQYPEHHHPLPPDDGGGPARIRVSA